MFPCKFCKFGVAALALTGLATAGGWAWLSSRPAPQPDVAPVSVASPGVEVLHAPQAYDPSEIKGPGHLSAGEMLQMELNRLHSDAVNRFLASEGFGNRRMVIFPKKVVKEWKLPWWSPGELDKDTPLDASKDLALIHRHSVQDFAISKQRPDPAAAKNVAPRPPIFGINPNQPRPDSTEKYWELKSLDLVGLVKHKEPVVYASETLPDMKKLDGVPTRPLDLFEFAAVEALQKGQNLFARGKDGTIRMLGAVRAQNECLTCHSAHKEGDLLGAFSYVMRVAEYRRDDFNFGGQPTAQPKPGSQIQPVLP